LKWSRLTLNSSIFTTLTLTSLSRNAWGGCLTMSKLTICINILDSFKKFCYMPHIFFFFDLQSVVSNKEPPIIWTRWDASSSRNKTPFFNYVFNYFSCLIYTWKHHFQSQIFFCNSQMTLPIGSKPITRSQRDYFGKGLQVLYPQKNFYMGMNFWMKFFITCFKKNWMFPNASLFFC
jgi:hypothetical protein